MAVFDTLFKEIKGVYMRKNRWYIAGMALLLACAPVFAGGETDVKSLAKQTADLIKQAEALQKEAEYIEETAANLPARDRRLYQQELVRMSFEAPQGLFNDAPALLTGAPEEAEDTDGGAKAKEKESATTAKAKESTKEKESGAKEKESSSVKAGSGGKTDAFFKTLEGKNYHMKAKTDMSGLNTDMGGMEVITDSYVKGDMIATVSEMGGMKFRSVVRDKKVYVIDDMSRTVTVMSLSAAAGNKPEEPVRTDGLIMTGSGTARFNGKNLPYEEYSTKKGSDAKVQLFIDGNKPAGIRTFVGKQTIDMIILVLDQNVPNNVFEIPSGYRRTEM
jgi:hypothetical protein